MGVPMLDLKAQYRTIKDEIDRAVLEVFESQYFVLGPGVKRFEEAVAEYSQCRHAVGVSSGTDALLISLMAEGIGPGDEVITTPYSFFATAGCIARVGATPVFVDIEPHACNMDPEKVEAAISPKTRAVLPVHLYGQVAEMDPINAIAESRNFAVIEDAAQSIGAEYKGRRAGSLGDYGCFSFYPSKNLGGAGDGGMVVTRSDEHAERLRILRDHGSHRKYYHRFVGGNFRLDALQAAVLMVKLKHLDDWTEGRRRNAAAYRKLFHDAGIVLDPENGMKGKNGIALPVELPERRHIYNQFVIRADRREELRELLKNRGIGHDVYYPVPFHLQECFAYLGHKQGDFPVAERAAEETLAIPIYPELTAAQLEEVVGTIADFYLVD